MTPPAATAALAHTHFTPDGTTIWLPPRTGQTAPEATALVQRLKAVHPSLALAAVFTVLLAIAALAPGLLTSVDPQAADANLAFLPPDAQHWLGTDENGRDVLARLIHGTGASLGLGVAAMAISLGIGIVVGLFGGLGGKVTDSASMRFADVMAALPSILFALLVITLWGQSTTNVIVAIGIATMPRYARLVRTTTRTIRNAPFVEAATTLGLRRATIVWRHILPNAVKPALLLAVIGIGDKIAFAAALSFLGFGAPPPAPEWGAMLAVGRNFVSVAPWLVAAPAILVTLTVLAVSAIGREVIRRGEGKTA